MRDVLKQAAQEICLSGKAHLAKKKRQLTVFEQPPPPSSLVEADAGFAERIEQTQMLNEERVTEILMDKTMTALRMFVNDELNELDFALRDVAAKFLNPDTGTLIAIIHTVIYLGRL